MSDIKWFIVNNEHATELRRRNYRGGITEIPLSLPTLYCHSRNYRNPHVAGQIISHIFRIKYCLYAVMFDDLADFKSC